MVSWAEGARATTTVLPGSPDLSGLRNAGGDSWEAIRAGLWPRFGIVWRDIAVSYGCIVGGFLAHAALAWNTGNRVGLGLALPAGCWIGYWMASLVCFMHEAAHYNIHPRKGVNDRLANIFLCPLVGEEIGHYRALHWQHHLNLGNLDDTEVSYRNAPTIRFILEALTGVHVWRVLATKRRAGQRTGKAVKSGSEVRALIRGAVLHGSILVATFAVGLTSSAVAWVLAVGIFYPFFGTMRQLLEHRSRDADPGVDYARVAHGPVNRMFGGDILSRTFGAAGFNRHLLHHWYPKASYTNFDELESFLMGTPLAADVDAARTTYGKTWCALTRRAGGHLPS